MKFYSNKIPNPNHDLIRFWKNPYSSTFLLIFVPLKIFLNIYTPFYRRYIVNIVMKLIGKIDEM